MLLFIGLLSVVGFAASDLITKGPANQTKEYSSTNAALEDVTFECRFDSSEDLSIQWLKSSSQLFNSSDYRISNYANSSTLTIFNVTTNDIDAYTCSANTSNSSEAKTAYLQVVVLLSITKHPISRNANQGSSVTFSCNATGFPTPNFAWKKDNTELGNSTRTRYSSDGKELFISSVQQSDAGNYTCEVSQPSYTPKQSATAVLTVNYIAKPLLVPNTTNVAVVEGTTVNISCSSDSQPVADIKWINASNAIITNSKFLAFNPVSRNNAGSYYCNATNVAGTLQSEATLLVVYYLDHPTFNTSSQNVVSIIEGRYLSVKCNSVANPNAQYRWTSSSGEIVSNTRHLVFPNIHRNDNETYTCVANNSVGLQKNSSLKIDVEYLDQPTFNTSSQNVVSIIEGRYLSVECNSVANPNAQYRWTSSSGEIVSNTRHLVFPNIHRNDNETYTCIANNSVGLQKNSSLKIDVEYLDQPTFNTSSQNAVSIIEGRYLSVECNSVANPNAQYRWTSSSGEIVSNTRYLEFPNIHRNDNETYTCVASNSAGLEKNSSLKIDVQYLDHPTFNTSSQNVVSIIEGRYLSVECNSVANPNAQYKWTSSSGEIVSNTRYLVFPTISRASARTYTCVTNNSAGLRKTSDLKVDVQYIDKPKLNTTSGTVTANEGSFLSISCNASANPKVHYMWTQNGTMVSNSSILSFSNINRSQANAYTCIASNGAGLQSRASVQIDVQYIDAPTTNLSSATATVNETDGFVINCSSVSHPAATYQWKTSSGTVISNSPILSFAGIKRNQNGSYTCVAANAAGEKSLVVSIVVNYLDKPQLNSTSLVKINGTLPRVNVTETTLLRVTCSATSLPQASFTWSKYQDSGYSLNGKDLVFNPIERNNNGTYDCLARNSVGTKHSVALIVDVQYIDAPTLNASNIIIVEGSPLNIQCLSVANPSPSYEWLKQDGSFVTASQVLSFASIHRNDTASYKCRAKNSINSKESKSILIEVQSIDQPIFNSITPLVVDEGTSITVNCSSVAYRIDAFKWETNDGIIVSNSSYLRFSPINRTDDNVYRCIGINRAGTKKSSNLTITVRYLDAPQFKQPGEVKINETDTISFSCSSVAFPPATFKWLDASGRIVSYSHLLKFNRISRRNATSYTCNASNIVATRSSKSVRVIVQYLDIPVVVSESFYRNGTESSANCTAEGYPRPNFLWFKGNNQVTRNSKLYFSKILVSDAGSYRCQVDNVIGMKSIHVDVNVTYKPTVLFTASANLPLVSIGTTVTLSCDVQSEPVAMVTLKHRNSVLESRVGSFSHSFQLQRNSNGSYSCDARNFMGLTSVQKEISVQEMSDEPQNFVVSQKGSRWILVTWEKPLFDGNSQITKYNLKIQSLNGGIYNETSMQKNVTNLHPFQNYTFVLSAINGMGLGRSTTLKGRTNSEAPPVPTKGLTSSSSSYYSATVKLRNFANSYGEIKYYRVVVVKWLQSLKKPGFYTNLKGFADPNTPYITAEFSADYFGGKSEIDFVIGDGTTTSRTKTTSRVRRATTQGYHNRPLEENSNYRAFLRAFIDDNTFSSTPWFDFKTSKKDTGLSGGAIAGIVIGVILAIVLVAFIVFYLKRRSQDYEQPEMDDRKPRRPSFFRGSSHKPVAADPNDPISIDALEKHVNGLKANSNYGFSQEYAKFDKKLKHPCTYSAHSVNSLKNRYANIHAYDHSRVVLQGDSTPGSDYINANFIRGFNGDQEYIAAQGPLPETISDFWRMVWEKSCSTIVMLTNCIENGRPKCAQYWPTQGSLTFKDIIVTSMEILEFPDHVVRTFHLTRAGQSLERTVKQFHYISWPDHGVPSDHTALFSVIKKVNRWRFMASEKAPLIVHCSAGVGRTGTYIVLDSQINRIRNGRDVNVYSNVQSLRDSRYLMVQTEDQYAYIHQALVEFIKSGDTEIDASELRDYIKRKSDVDPDTGSTGMMDEFVALARTNSQLTFTEANKSVNHTKNRYKNVYPYDSTRVVLSQAPGLAGSDYINANHIDGYIDVKAFIATQAPLPTTFDDFWRMIWENDSRTIVMLSKEQESGKVKVNCYWPAEGSIKIGIWIIELLKTSTFNEYTLRELKLTNSEQGKSIIVRHYQYTAWPESGPPESAFGIIDLLGQVSKWNSTVGNRVISVHCSAGVGRTGVFIALTNLIERLKTEAVVDVYQTVKKLRQQRTAMVQTKDQYEFCYQALQEYLDSFDHYSNFE